MNTPSQQAIEAAHRINNETNLGFHESEMFDVALIIQSAIDEAYEHGYDKACEDQRAVMREIQAESRPAQDLRTIVKPNPDTPL